MNELNTNESTARTGSTAQMRLDRRMSTRHQTTIIVQDELVADEVSQRGDINKSGFFFLPELNLVEGEELELKVRLPGIGEWVECNGVVTGVAVRGGAQGIVGLITKTTDTSKDTLGLWQEMAA